MSFELGLGYAVVSALLFGGYLVLIKQRFTAYPGPVYLAGVNGFAFLTYLPIALVTIDGPLVPAGLTIPGLGLVAFISALTGVAILAMFRALVEGAVSYVAPISKLVPLFVLPLEILLLGEVLSPIQIAGVLVATAAIYVANYEPGELIEPFRRALTTRAPQLALASAAMFGVVDVGKRVMMQELAIPPQLYLPVMFAITTTMVLPFARRRPLPATARSDAWLFAVAGLIVAVGNHIVLLAFQLLPASIASPVINAQAVVAVVAGGLLLGESHFRVRLVAAALAIVGIALITVG